MVNFQVFQQNCKYAQYGLKQDRVRNYEITCRNPDCVPKGYSWGACDEAHCPYFGVKCRTCTMIDVETGDALFSFTDGTIVFGN